MEAASKELIKDGSIWKNENGSWSRKCPQCGESIEYIGVSDRRIKDTCRKAHVKKCVCAACRASNRRGVELKALPEGVWKNKEGHWCRVCPSCNETVIHKGSDKNKSKCVFAHRRQRQCKVCSTKKLGESGAEQLSTWTQEEEDLLRREGTNKLLHELVEMLPNHTALGIRSKRNRLGIVLPDEYISKAASYNRSLIDPDDLCKLDQTWTLDDLTNDEFQVLIGCQLGDGSIKKNGRAKPNGDGSCVQRNYTFYCSHNHPCGNYTEWKIKILNRFAPRRWANDKRTELITASHPIFTKLRDRFYSARYQCDKDIIPMDLIKKLDLFGLMIWYLDDGYLGVPQDGMINNPRNPIHGKKVHKQPAPHIIAKGYQYNELVEVCNILNRRFDLSLNVGTAKHREGINKFINIPAKDRGRVLGTWRELAKQYDLPECMYYKLNMHNPELLARELVVK